ncbi:ankyrin repeat domain-containing protein 9 [Nerophis ophidion]|uniref:ankyrin repeat domain-containing protein 9 n=1 Tax=Nerophis ophidion TaxID=159077 RepID=UPI002ADF8FA9|nr:ankyrin repeat domain-containing protein 9 [Nerophis ophidion]
MPWLRSSPPETTSSSSPSQRHCERTAFAFYCAVREQLPVWLLEDMRSMEVFFWEDGRPRSVSPSDALMYALVHDHRDYARFLLASFSVNALRTPRCSVCRSSGSAHLHVAVRYNRRAILGLILDTVRDFAPEDWRREYVNSCAGCAHGADAGKTAVQLAVELSRGDCLLPLLVHGAQPHSLDAALFRLAGVHGRDRGDARHCLDLLLLFVSEPVCRLRDEQQRWQRILGKDVFSWLSGQAPPPLLLQALRTLARCVPGQIPHLPAFLQPHGQGGPDIPLPGKPSET